MHSGPINKSSRYFLNLKTMHSSKEHFRQCILLYYNFSQQHQNYLNTFSLLAHEYSPAYASTSRYDIIEQDFSLLTNVKLTEVVCLLTCTLKRDIFKSHKKKLSIISLNKDEFQMLYAFMYVMIFMNHMFQFVVFRIKLILYFLRQSTESTFQLIFD